MGVLVIRALLFLIYMRAPIFFPEFFWKLPNWGSLNSPHVPLKYGYSDTEALRIWAALKGSPP